MSNDDHEVAQDVNLLIENDRVLDKSKLSSIQIKKSHGLLMAIQNLNAREQDMMALFLTRAKEEDVSEVGDDEQRIVRVPSYVFGPEVLKEWFNVDRQHLGATLEPAAEKLVDRKLGFKNYESRGRLKEFQFFTLFSEIHYADGHLRMQPNHVAWPHLFDYATHGFALVNHRTFRMIQGSYAKRMYELLCRFQKGGLKFHVQKVYDLQVLYGVINPDNGDVIKKSLAKPSQFIRRVIQEPLRELANNPFVRKELVFLKDEESGEIGYRPIKSGRSTEKVEFLYQWINKATSPDGYMEAEAKSTVRKLENKRLLNEVELSIEELKELSEAYGYLQQYEKVAAIAEAVKRREALKVEEVQEESKSDASISDEIELLERLALERSGKQNVPDY